jgi:hypothetical protein
MTKFIQVKTRENSTYYINVDAVRYVVQNTQQGDRCMIRFFGDDQVTIEESAANFVARASAD